MTVCSSKKLVLEPSPYFPFELSVQRQPLNQLINLCNHFTVVFKLPLIILVIRPIDYPFGLKL